MKSFKAEIKVNLLVELDEEKLCKELTSYIPKFFQEYSPHTFEQFVAASYEIFCGNEYNQINEIYNDTVEYRKIMDDLEAAELIIAQEVYNNYIKENNIKV